MFVFKGIEVIQFRSKGRSLKIQMEKTLRVYVTMKVH